LIPDVDKYNWVMIDSKLPVSLRFFVRSYWRIQDKKEQLDGQSLLQCMHKLMWNQGLTCDKEEIAVPAYFSDHSIKGDPEVFKEWPIVEECKMNYTHVVEKPKFMQPKTMPTVESNYIFFVSPRKFIMRVIVQGYNYIYADCFAVEQKLTVTQPDPTVDEIHFYSEHRVNWHKPMRLLHGIMMKETEKQVKEAIAVTFKTNLFEKLILLKQAEKEGKPDIKAIGEGQPKAAIEEGREEAS